MKKQNELNLETDLRIFCDNDSRVLDVTLASMLVLNDYIILLFNLQVHSPGRIPPSGG